MTLDEWLNGLEEIERGIAHAGCDYLASYACNKCGWINPNQHKSDTTLKLIRLVRAAVEMREKLVDCNSLTLAAFDAALAAVTCGGEEGYANKKG